MGLPLLHQVLNVRHVPSTQKARIIIRCTSITRLYNVDQHANYYMYMCLSCSYCRYMYTAWVVYVSVYCLHVYVHVCLPTGVGHGYIKNICEGRIAKINNDESKISNRRWKFNADISEELGGWGAGGIIRSTNRRKYIHNMHAMSRLDQFWSPVFT